MSQQVKGFKQRYYRNINSLSFCNSVLLSGHVEPENIAAFGSVQTTILYQP